MHPRRPGFGLPCAVAIAVLALPAVAAAEIQVSRPGAGPAPGPDQVTVNATGADEIVTLTDFVASTGSGHTIELESLAGFASPTASGCTLSNQNTKVECTGVEEAVLYVFLGAGTDQFSVLPGSDQLHVAVFGGQGRDDVTGGEGDDFLRGGGGDDIVEGRGGDDDMDGYAGEGNPPDGPDAADLLVAGDGADRMYDSGGTPGDRVTYFGRAQGVTVTLDGNPNDGNVGSDGPTPGGSPMLGADDVDAGIDWVQGTNHTDVITGNGENNILHGNGGNDTLTGGDGHDDFLGGTGDDTLNARDSDDDTADLVIDCGGPGAASPGDVANIDRADPQPVNCAKVNRSGAQATQDGGGTTGGTTPPPATDQPGFFAPPAPAGDPVALQKLLDAVKTTSTRDVSRMPRLTGVRVDRARDTVRRAKIVADIDVREVAAPRKGIDIGTVVAHQPRAGTRLSSDATRPVRIRLDVVEGPRGKGSTCPSAAELRELKGVDLDLVQSLLESRGCKKVDLKLVESPKATEPVAQTITLPAKGAPAVTVAVPTAPRRQDLFLIVREGAVTRSDLQGIGLDWALPARQTAIGAQVIDRAGRLVRNAEVTFDLSAVGGNPRSQTYTTREQGQIGDGGADAGGLRISRPGIVDVLIKAADRTGQALWGSAQIRTVDRGRTEWMTTVGRAFLGDTCRVGARCVTDWLGGQEVPDQGFGIRPRVGPEAPAFEGQYARMVPLLQTSVAFDSGAVNLLGSSRLSAVNKLRVLAGEGRYGHVPAQLAVRGSEPLSAAPAAPVFVKNRLWALEGSAIKEYSDTQISASQPGALVAAKTGQWSTILGLGRAFDNPSGLVDARRAEIIRFPDGTAALSTGTVPPAAGAAGVVAVWGR